MNEEEAIEICKDIRDKEDYFGHLAIETVLNLIKKQQAEIEDLKKSVDYTYEAYQDAGNKMFDYTEEIEKKDRQLKIKDEYLKLIRDLGFDYDGFDTVQSLKELIDQLIDYAVKAIKNDDKYEVYEGSNGNKFNILLEKIKEDK